MWKTADSLKNLTGADLRLLHPSQQLVDEPQASFVLWRRHGHQLGASHGSPQERGSGCSHGPQQSLSQREAAVGGSLAGEFCPGAAQSLREVAFPVNAGALQSEGDQLLLKAGHSVNETETRSLQRGCWRIPFPELLSHIDTFPVKTEAMKVQARAGTAPHSAAALQAVWLEFSY